MKLVTVATHSEGYFPWLLQSCERFGAKLDILGWGEKWKGFAWRLTLMIKYLEKLNPNEVVCFVDGFDVILLKPLDDLEARFLHVKKDHDFKIAVSLEIPILQVQQWTANLTFGKCQSEFINAGAYIGYAGDLLEVIHGIYKINPQFNADDQQMLLSYCRNDPKQMYIDKDRNMFLTLVYSFKDISEHIQPYADNEPCIYHGAANTNMNNLIRALGYNMTEKEEATINEYHWNTQKKKVIYYSGLFMPFIIGIVVAILLVILCTIYLNSVVK